MATNRKPKRSLRERLGWPSTLFRAFSEISRGANPDSHGPDGVTVDSFRRNAKSEIARLQKELKEGEYSHSLGRGVAILKKPENGAQKDNVRPITVYNVRDRVIRRAVSNLLWVHLRDEVFSEVSYGGIRTYKKTNGATRRSSSSTKKNVEAAARRILELKKSGFEFTFETDIRQFFPSIDKARLLSQLSSLLPDDSLRSILESAISTSICNAPDIDSRGLSECWDPAVGVPQGGVLSPLFANLYLAPFDREMTRSGFELVRYVDDLVIPTRSEVEAASAYEKCKIELGKLGLNIHDLDAGDSKGRIKTRIVKAGDFFDFLGLRVHRKSIHPTPHKLGDLKERINLATDAFRGDATLIDVVAKLNRLLRGWMAAYAFCDIPPDLQNQIDEFARRRLASWMEKCRLVKNINSIDPGKARKIGLWSVMLQEIRPISRPVFAASESAKPSPINKLVAPGAAGVSPV